MRNNRVYLVFVLFLMVSCEPLTLRGKVIDHKSSGIADVKVSVKNSELKTTSESSGEFVLPKLKLYDTIIFSKAGYLPKEIIYSRYEVGRRVWIIMNKQPEGQPFCNTIALHEGIVKWAFMCLLRKRI